MDGEQGRGFAAPGGPQEQAAVSFTPPEPELPSTPGPPPMISAVVERNRRQLLEVDGVHGVGVGRTAIGDDAVRVDVEHDGVRSRLPGEVEGYPVEVVVVPGGFGILPAGAPYTG